MIYVKNFSFFYFVTCFMIISFFGPCKGCQKLIVKKPSLYEAVADCGHHRLDVSQLSQFLQSGVNVDEPISGGWTPLHLAVGLNRTDLVSLLLKFGANPQQYNSFGISPLIHAVAWQSEQVLPLLLEQASVHHHDSQGRSLLYVAILSWSQRCNIAEFYEQAPGMHSDDSFYDSHNPVYTLVQQCPNFKIVMLLLQKGARMHDPDIFGNTAFQMAQRSANSKQSASLSLLKRELWRRKNIVDRIKNFLLVSHERVGKRSLAHVLPKELFQHIFEYLFIFEHYAI